MHPAHRLYVGTIGEGVFRSLDGDWRTFARACDGEGMFVECHVRALVVHPADDRILYLGTENGLFRSADGAGSWSRLEGLLDGRQIWSLALAAGNPDVIMVGTCPAKIFVSADAGRTWQECSTPMREDCPRIIHTRVTCLLSDPERPGTFWAGVEIDGLFRSMDWGRTWERVGKGLTSQDIHALAKVSGPVMLAATNNDLNISRDGGLTWTGLNIGNTMPWAYCRTLKSLPGRPEAVLLGNGNGPPGSAGAVGLTYDGGESWNPCAMHGTDQTPVQPNSTIWNFAVHKSDANFVYASSVSGQVFRSHDQGKSWQKLTREFGEIRALAWTP